MYTFFFDLAEFCKGKDLKSAGVSKDWALPIHKFVKSAKLLHYFVTWTHMQMIGIRQLHLCSNIIKVLCGNSTFYCADRSYVHEYRGLDRTMDSLKLSTLRTALRFH